MKKILTTLSLLGPLALLLGSSVPTLAADADVVVNAPVEVTVDSDFTVTVDVSSMTDFDAGQFDITFDTSVLRLDDVANGLIGGTAIPVSQWNEISTGTYRTVVNVSGVPGVTGSGYLAVLHFHAVGSASDSSTIQISNGFLNNNEANEITATWTGDSTTVYEEINITTTSFPIGVVGSAYSETLQATGGNGSYTWSLQSGSLPDGLSLSSAGVVSGTPTTSGTSDFTAQVTDGTLSDTIVCSITIVHLGDADDDGTVGSSDVTKVERIILALDSETEGADANQDGVVNTADITKIERIIAGLD